MKTQIEQLAVFFDIENAESKKADRVFAKLQDLGNLALKKGYADWGKPNLKPWEAKVRKHAVETVHQLSTRSGKNSSDLCLSIDAMDILHTSPQITIFVIVSSDGDFSPLAHKIKSYNKIVIGVGNNTTPQAFRRACTMFIFTDSLKEAHPVTGTKESLLNQFDLAFSQGVDATGNCLLSTLNNYLKRNNPDFNVDDYGKKSLFGLAHTMEPHYEVIAVPPRPVYIRRGRIGNIE